MHHPCFLPVGNLNIPSLLLLLMMLRHKPSSLESCDSCLPRQCPICHAHTFVIQHHITSVHAGGLTDVHHPSQCWPCCGLPTMRGLPCLIPLLLHPSSSPTPLTATQPIAPQTPNRCTSPHALPLPSQPGSPSDTPTPLTAR